jgi:hypothetical protein
MSQRPSRREILIDGPGRGTHDRHHVVDHPGGEHQRPGGEARPAGRELGVDLHGDGHQGHGREDPSGSPSMIAAARNLPVQMRGVVGVGHGGRGQQRGNDHVDQLPLGGIVGGGAAGRLGGNGRTG